MQALDAWMETAEQMLGSLPKSPAQPRTSGAPDVGSEAALGARIEEYRAAVESYKADSARAADLLGHYKAEDLEVFRKHAAAMEAWTSVMQPIIAARAPGAAAALNGPAQPRASGNTNPMRHAPPAPPAVAAERSAQPRALGDPNPSPQGPPAPSVEALARARARDRVRRPIVPYDDSDYDELQGSLPPRGHASAMATKAPSTAELAASEATRGGAEAGFAASARCSARRLKSVSCFRISVLSFQGRHTAPDLSQKRQCSGRGSYGCRQTQPCFARAGLPLNGQLHALRQAGRRQRRRVRGRRGAGHAQRGRAGRPGYIPAGRGGVSQVGGGAVRGPRRRVVPVDVITIWMLCKGKQYALSFRLRKCSP